MCARVLTLHSGEIATSVGLSTVAAGSDASPLCRHSLPPPSVSLSLLLHLVVLSFIFPLLPLFDSSLVLDSLLRPCLPLFHTFTIPSYLFFPLFHLIFRFILLISSIFLCVPSLCSTPSSFPLSFLIPLFFLPSLSPITDPIKHWEGHSRRRVTEVRQEREGRQAASRETLRVSSWKSRGSQKTISANLPGHMQ